MNNKQIEERLKSILSSAKLPSCISFETNKDRLFVKLGGRGVVANMQTDKSAFEGWSILLKSDIPNIKNIILDWENPLFNTDKDKRRREETHYNRFLIRVANFKHAYPWFDISKERISEVAKMQKFLDSGTIVVNFPQKPCKPVANGNKKREAALERELVESLRKGCPITDEQLPVGLFRNGIVSKANALTPSGASQIDLWQLDNDTMKIYELKVKGNESIGIISELFYYVCIVKNIVEGHIKYPDVSKAVSHRHFKDFADAVTNEKIHKIIGYFAAPRLHPLLESPQLKDKVFEILNGNMLGIQFEFYDVSYLIEQ